MASAHRVRLHTVSEGGKPGGWVAAIADVHQWLQVNFGGVVKVTRVGTQGKMDLQTEAEFVSRYSLSFSQDGGSFYFYQHNGTVKVR